jgi:hypothetical protein
VGFPVQYILFEISKKSPCMKPWPKMSSLILIEEKSWREEARSRLIGKSLQVPFPLDEKLLDFYIANIFERAKEKQKLK